ncbi:MAG: hypothetical protein H6993_16330 [Pseudomonadales bacterium]|nr:hypothetical protein [Pseudomonadales bacterium]
MTDGRWQRARQVVTIGGAFLALLCGSGFSTGQEALQFFAAEGLWGLGGTVIFLLLGGYVCVSLLLAGRAHGCHNMVDVFRHFAGPVLGKGFTWYASVMLFSIYALMLSGAGTVANEALGLPVMVGAGLMAVIVFATLYFGLHELVAIVGSLGPLLIVLILAVAAASVIGEGDAIAVGAAEVTRLPLQRAASSWWLAGLLYTTLSIMGLFVFMPAVGAEITDVRVLVLGGLLGPFLFALTMALVVLALLAGIDAVQNRPIPMLVLAQRQWPLLSNVYVAVMLAAIYTTAAPLLWAVLTRFAADASRRYHALAAILSLVGWFGSTLLPFDRFVNLVYPSIGYVGILLVICLVVKQVIARSMAG